MKKLLTLIAFLTITNSGYSQSFRKVQKSIYIEYINGRWVESLVKYPDDMYIMMYKNEISINNQSDAKYYTYGSPERQYFYTHTTYTWDAYDKKGRNCTIMMKTSESSSVMNLEVLYLRESYGFEYITE